MIRIDNMESVYENLGKEYSLKFFSKNFAPLFSFKNIVITKISDILNANNIKLEASVTILYRLNDVVNIRMHNFDTKKAIAEMLDLSSCKYFNFDTFWDQYIYKECIKFYDKTFAYVSYLPNADIDYQLEEYMDQAIERQKDFLIDLVKYDIHLLSKSSRLDSFLAKNRKNFNMIILYFNQRLITQSPEVWFTIFKCFCEYIHIENLKRIKGEKYTLGILVDYDLHRYLKEEKDFYDKLIKIENTQLSEVKPSTRSIDLSGQDRIEFNDLKNLAQVDRLDLSNNLLIKLDYYSFCPLDSYRNLIELNLRKNRLTYVEQKAFENLHLLESLDLSSNFLNQITEDMLGNLGNLKSLNLSNNQIEDLRPGCFESLIKLKRLNLSSNYLSNLNSDKNKNLFSDMSSLEVLDLSFNKLILNLASESFQDLKSLKELYLDHNRIQEIKIGLLSKLSKLEVLNLSNNRISNLKRENLEGLKSLKILLLNENFLKYLENGVFQSSSNLLAIFLHSNCLNFIEKDCFDNLKLRAVTLFNNYFKDQTIFKNLIGSKNLRIKYFLLDFDPIKLRELKNSSKLISYQNLISKELCLNKK